MQTKTVSMKATSSFDYQRRELLKLEVLTTFEWAYKIDLIAMLFVYFQLLVLLPYLYFFLRFPCFYTKILKFCESENICYI